MEFIVRRVSTFDPLNREKTQPCSSAVLKKFTRTSIVWCPDFAEFPKLIPNWYEEGYNYRRKCDYWYCRDSDFTDWTIEIKNLAELIEFIRNHGRIIVNEKSVFIPTVPVIEIYDKEEKDYGIRNKNVIVPPYKGSESEE